MAGRIQGITVEIGGDTTKLQTALKGVNTEIDKTYSMPKSRISYRKPRRISEAKREQARIKMMEINHNR